MQLPRVLNETTPALIEQTALLVASTVMLTVRPELDVAVGVYVAPPTVVFVGAVLV